MSHLTAESLATFKASKIDEISLCAGDIVCIYNKMDDHWAEGHNLTQDSFGVFPIGRIKYINVQNYRFLNAKQVKIKRLDTLFRNSDSETDADYYASRLQYSADLDWDERIEIIINDLKEGQNTFTDQMLLFIQTIVDPLLSEPWLLNSHQEFLKSFKQVYEFHFSLGEALMKVNQDTKIWDTLLQFSNDFQQVYSKYARLLPQAVSMGSKYMRTGEINDFVLTNHQDISSYSAVFLKKLAWFHIPFQKRKDIFSFIRKVLQLIPVDHPDHQNFLVCWKSFKITISALEQIFSISESEEEISNLQSQLLNYQGPPLSDFGMILLKAPFKVGNGRRKRPRFVYLLEKCILILKGKETFFNQDCLSEFSIRSNSAPEISIDQMILLDSEHFRTVAAWDAYDKNAFRVIYVDNNGSSHFIELSASARKIARIWINEIRNVTHQNYGNQSRDSISINLTSSGTSSSTKSKASTYSHSSGSSANKLNPRPRVDSLLIPSVSFPKSVKIQPNLISDSSPYLSPPVMGYKCEMKEINIDNMYKPISPETQNESLYSDSLSPIEHINARERYSISSFNSDFMNDMGLSDSENCDDKFMQNVDGPGTTTTTDSDNFYDTIAQEPHISGLQIADFKISPTITKSSSEDDDHSIVRESLQSCQRISRKEFKSLYNSMQVKVQEYLELKNRIDSIVGNLNKT